MHNPRYRGQTKDGGVYIVTAKTAKQDPKQPNHILLSRVSGDLTQKNGSTVTLAALSGSYDTQSEVITLFDDVKLNGSSGAWAHLQRVTIENNTGLITSAQPVRFGNPRATIMGRTLKIRQKSKEMTVTGQVVATISAPQSKDDAAASPTTPAAMQHAAMEATAVTGGTSPALTRMFTRSKGPIKITSDRLDIDDIKKTAIFVGNVIATQGETRLTSPELRIAYDGAPSGGLTGAQAKAPDQLAEAADTGKAEAADTARIVEIVAADPVTITQAPATHMTARTATFDALAQRAALSGGVTITRAPDTRITGQTAGFDDISDIANIIGDVVLTQGSDRRATGDHAEFRNAQETALLTGNVVLTQGQNVLRGRRLYIDRKAQRTELTAPPMGTSGPGRITAHFVRPNAGSQRAPAKARTRSGGLMPMTSFQTEPGAPVDIAADQLEVFEAKKLAVFRGKVEASQGSFKFRTNELNAIYTGEAGIAKVAGAARDADGAERASGNQGARITMLQARGKVVVTSLNGPDRNRGLGRFQRRRQHRNPRRQRRSETGTERGQRHAACHQHGHGRNRHQFRQLRGAACRQGKPGKRLAGIREAIAPQCRIFPQRHAQEIGRHRKVTERRDKWLEFDHGADGPMTS